MVSRTTLTPAAIAIASLEGEERELRVRALRHLARSYRQRGTTPTTHQDLITRADLLAAADSTDELARELEHRLITPRLQRASPLPEPLHG